MLSLIVRKQQLPIAHAFSTLHTQFYSLLRIPGTACCAQPCHSLATLSLCSVTLVRLLATTFTCAQNVPLVDHLELLVLEEGAHLRLPREHRRGHLACDLPLHLNLLFNGCSSMSTALTLSKYGRYHFCSRIFPCRLKRMMK